MGIGIKKLILFPEEVISDIQRNNKGNTNGRYRDRDNFVFHDEALTLMEWDNEWQRNYTTMNLYDGREYLFLWDNYIKYKGDMQDKCGF